MKNIYVLMGLLIIGTSLQAAKQTITIQNKSSYEMFVSADGQKTKMKPLGIGKEDSSDTLAMRIFDDRGADRSRVELNIVIPISEGSGTDSVIKNIRKTIQIYGPKEAFKDLRKIGIDYSKVFTFKKGGKFTLSFEPKYLKEVLLVK